MAHSSLATIAVSADPGNYTAGRPTRIRSITLHHMAGVNSAEGCGRIFQTPGRGGSSHYGIGVNGEIGVYVEEENTAWTNSNWASNCESVTIENSNSSVGGDWPVSDATLNSCIKLVADIAKRNGLGTLVPGNNLTWHSMFAPTTCPGDYLRARVQYIADEANKINQEGPAPVPPAPAGGFSRGDQVVPRDYVDYNGTRLLKTRDFYFISSISGDRAVLSADSVDGPIYAAMNTGNLDKVGGSPAPSRKSNEEIADEVIRGDWGNGQERIDRLTAAGYDYNAIQAIVNARLGGGSPAPVDNSIHVGDRVSLSNYVDYNGTGLFKTRDFYYVSEINGDRAVLCADSANGAVYAAVNIGNLYKV